MFRRGKQPKHFDLADYPEFNVMLQRAYNEGCRDTLAAAKDVRDAYVLENDGRDDRMALSFVSGMSTLIEQLEG